MRTGVNKGTQWILSISSSWLHPLEPAVGKEVVRNQKRKFPYPFFRTTGPNIHLFKMGIPISLMEACVAHGPPTNFEQWTKAAQQQQRMLRADNSYRAALIPKV